MTHARKLENIVPHGHTNADIIENERETGFRTILPFILPTFSRLWQND